MIEAVKLFQRRERCQQPNFLQQGTVYWPNLLSAIRIIVHVRQLCKFKVIQGEVQKAHKIL